MHSQGGHHREARTLYQFFPATAPSNRQVVSEGSFAKEMDAQAIAIGPALEVLGPDICLAAGQTFWVGDERSENARFENS